MTSDLTEFKMATVVDSETGKPMTKMRICGEGTCLDVKPVSYSVSQESISKNYKRMGVNKTLKALHLFNSGEEQTTAVISLTNGAPFAVVPLEVGETKTVDLYDVLYTNGISVTAGSGTGVATLVSRE